MEIFDMVSHIFNHSKIILCEIRLCLPAVFLWIPWPHIPVTTIGFQVRNLFKGTNSERISCEYSAIFLESCIPTYLLY